MPRQSSIKILVILFFPILLSLVFVVTSNSEVDELYSWLRTSPSFSAHFSDWNPLDSNPCEWSHVNCSAESFVTGINIDGVELGLSLPSKLSSFPRLQKLVVTNANLSGTISSDIQFCSDLTVIDLSFNGLKGNIPSSIGKLGKLQELVLNSNQLTGEIPGELGNCAELRDLIIFDNFLAGEIPQELGGLLKLESIRAGGNKDIAGEIPPELGGCESLRVLGLADTKISGAIPPEIGRLSRLETLSVYTTMISGEIPSEIGNCSELVELFLYQNELSGAIPPEIGRLGKLEKMLLWQNDLAGAIPEEIGECRSLRVVDLSLNSLYGKIPESFANLSNLEELMLSNNNISGSIPSVLFNATKIVQLQLDTNRISGYIPAEIGRLTLLEVFFAWDNLLEGKVPAELSGCRSLQALDLSRNELTGEMPAGLFEIQNLTKLLLMSNRISGNIPAEIGGCASLVRLRLSDNIIGGEIPSEIGLLKALTFLDLSGNRLSGSVPREIGDCGDLQLLNLSNNTLGGDLPISLSSLSKLQVLDLSLNKLHGQIPTEYGRLSSLNRLVLGQNSLSSSIPTAISNCSALQLLDLSRNDLTGPIPAEIFQIQALEIALNLSFNALSGPISPEISSLGKLSVLDLSHNTLSGELLALAGLENLVSLNISHNNFTGFMPDSKLFRQLSPNDVEANPGLCSTCFLALLNGPGAPSPAEISRRRGLKLLAATLVALTIALVALGSVAAFRSRRSRRRSGDESESERGGGAPAPPWQFTPFQKLSFTAEQVMKSLSEANVIGKGVSGVVYRAELGSGETIAVKKLWPAVPGSGGRDSFSAEVETLGSIRHKNIVRLLGCCRNKKTRLLMYDYMVNGSLGSLLHENGGGLEWETRYKIAVGSAHGLAYLHHDCVPPIVHRDIKANNILVGDDFEPYIADFGLAKLVNNGDFGRSSNTVAGSYGYIAPEYGYMMKITEKSDVYSFGVVLLEVLTGKQPIDPTIPEGLHIVDWMRQKRGLLGPEVLDRTLQARPDPEIDEMLQTLGVALLCVNPSPDERPTMKDVAAMLQEIRHQDLCTKIEMLNKTVVSLGSDCSNKNNVDGAQIGRNINTSFSASSLLHSSSSSNAK